MATEVVVKAMLAAFAQNWPEKAEHCKQQDTVAFWHRYLEDMDDGLLRATSKTILSEAKYFPKVADVREMAFRLQADVVGVPDAYQAWNMVKKWMRLPPTLFCDGKHHRRRPLPPMIQKAVDGIGGVDMLGMSENETADRARFVEAYNNLMGRMRHQATMLPEVRELVQRAALPDGLKKLLPERETTVTDHALSGSAECADVGAKG